MAMATVAASIVAPIVVAVTIGFAFFDPGEDNMGIAVAAGFYALVTAACGPILALCFAVFMRRRV